MFKGTTQPSLVSGYGALFVNQSDKNLYYIKPGSNNPIDIPYKQTAGIEVAGKLKYDHTWTCTFVEGEDKKVFEYLKRIDMTPHVANFDMCYFWDSGLHCLSSDVYREGHMPDYWPNRGNNGVYYINEQ